MNREKTVYVLGAGSTIGHSNGIFPDIKSIFGKALELGITGNGKILESNYKSLDTFLADYFDYSLISGKKLDFEKVFTLVEIEREKDEITYGQIRQQLIIILQNVFMKLKDKLKSDNEYVKFVEILEPYDTVITFNWDILLDDKLDRIGWLETYSTEKKDRCKDSSINFVGPHYERFIKSQVSQPFRPSSSISFDKEGFYLKLHGSMDWYICQNTSCKFYNIVTPKLYPLKNSKCSYCYDPSEVLIVPPILNKSVNRIPFIGIQWNIAKEEIQSCKKLVVWGYSLPPTDFYSECLFRRAKSNVKLNEIILINRNEDHRGRLIPPLFHRE